MMNILKIKPDLCVQTSKNGLNMILNSSFGTITKTSKPTLLVLGCGWGSYSLLKNINRKKFRVKVITPRNYFLFTPLLCSTTVGTLEFRSITESLRNIGFDEPSDMQIAKAESLDLKNKVITYKSALYERLFNVSYDKLIIGVGCRSNTFNVPGVIENASFLKDIKDAQGIRNRIIQNCERATFQISREEKKRLLHTVIVGGGPAGVEFGAELYDFKVEDVRKLYRHEGKYFGVTLVEAAKILSSFDTRLQAFAEKKIRQRANFNLIKASVVEVTAESVTLNDGKVLPCGLVVWSTGLSPQPFVQNLQMPKNKQGQILTDKFLKVIGDPSGNTYAIGDCSDIEDFPLPCTAQVAERQGRYLAHVLNTEGKDIFHFVSKGMLAYIGGYSALTDLPDFKASGLTSWFVWRSAYFTRLFFLAIENASTCGLVENRNYWTRYHTFLIF